MDEKIRTQQLFDMQMQWSLTIDIISFSTNILIFQVLENRIKTIQRNESIAQPVMAGWIQKNVLRYLIDGLCI